MAETYSSWTGLVYIFNLIVGTGALTLPAAFRRSGWALGSVLMCILSFVSYVTATFVVEAMATSNALLNFSKAKQLKRIGHYLDLVCSQAHQISQETSESEEEGGRSASEESPLTAPGSIQNFPSDPVTFYTVDNKVEMGEMAALLFNKGGRLAFFLCFVSYLYGDLSIYASAVGQSLVDTYCTSNNFTDPDDNICKPDHTYSTMQAYRVFLMIFLLLLGPFVFFNVQKTKYIQLFTTLARWLAFGVMIYLTVGRLLDPVLPHPSPQPAVVSGFPSLFSSCVYAFMCHHSLPSLLSPISNKSKLQSSLAADYILVLFFYLILAVPAVFAFSQINDLFTLNFVPQPGDSEYQQIMGNFLILFPVFTLSASFPIISVTLRNNLQAVVAGRSKMLRSVVLPLSAVIPPVLLASFFPNLEILVGITGAYAGVGIQYVIPAMLVMSARRTLPRELTSVENPFASPFRHPAWPLLVILWAIICISFSTVHIINSHTGS